VFSLHLPALKHQRLTVVAGCDVAPQPGQQRARELGCPFFSDHRQMLAETRPDVVAILAPHPFHARLALDALDSGAHVLVEKPLAVHLGEADAMVERAQHVGRLLAVNFQHRMRADVRAARGLIEAGRLGALQRVEVTATWLRTASYYRLADWRVTWQGEGGGVLMNQAPHNLDLVCHLVGQPRSVVAWNRTLVHAIETEDTSVSILEWPNGALGTLLVSTAQTGEPEHIEIVGTRGALVLRQGRLTFSEAATDLRQFVRESDEPFGKLTFTEQDVQLETERHTGDHRAIYDNLVAAIEDGAPLVADGADGRQSLELANALILSSHTDRRIDLPIDRSAYAALLDALRRGGKPD
jgi:predicted dehydrogenase